MKKMILIVGAAFALVACNQNQGGASGTGEYPQTGTGSSTASNAPVTTPNSTESNTNTGAAGAATTPGGNEAGTANGTATANTNSNGTTR